VRRNKSTDGTFALPTTGDVDGLGERTDATRPERLGAHGTGDQLDHCDVNHSAQSIVSHTAYGRLIGISGCGLVRAAEATPRLFPVDTFVEVLVKRMPVVGDRDK
jgi:L-fucose mutarotase/ribose pyranase (RbsD/FucU family)